MTHCPTCAQLMSDYYEVMEILVPEFEHGSLTANTQLAIRICRDSPAARERKRRWRDHLLVCEIAEQNREKVREWMKGEKQP